MDAAHAIHRVIFRVSDWRPARIHEVKSQDRALHRLITVWKLLIQVGAKYLTRHILKLCVVHSAFPSTP